MHAAAAEHPTHKKHKKLTFDADALLSAVAAETGTVSRKGAGLNALSVMKSEFDEKIQVKGEETVVVLSEDELRGIKGKTKACLFGSVDHMNLLQARIKELETESGRAATAPAPKKPADGDLAEETMKRLLEERKKLQGQILKLKDYANKGQIDISKIVEPTKHDLVSLPLMFTSLTS